MKTLWTAALAALMLSLPQSVLADDDDDALLDAIELPAKAEELRKKGVEKDKVREVLEQGKDAGLEAGDLTSALDVELETVEKTGKTDTFGSFVKAQVESGKKGKELAAEIHAANADRKAARAQSRAAKRADKAAGKAAKGEDKAAAKAAKGENKAAAKAAKGEDKAADAAGKDKAADAASKGKDKAADAAGKGKDKAADAAEKGARGAKGAAKKLDAGAEAAGKKAKKDLKGAGE